MIKIMTDSASDCNTADISIPVAINIDGREYLDGVDIDSDKFYKLLAGTDTFPKTSQPSPETFLKEFEKIKAAGDELIYFSISSALSGTYQSACIAKTMSEYDGIYIIDSKAATHIIGVLVDYAKKRISEGADAKKIVEECESLKSRVRVLAGVETLEYLRRGGRLSGAAAAVGTLARVKPILTVTEDGRVEAIGKALGCAKAMQFICDKLKAVELDDSFPVCSLYTSGEENCIKLESKLESNGIHIQKRLQIGATIGTHTGAGVYGVLFVIK